MDEQAQQAQQSAMAWMTQQVTNDHFGAQDTSLQQVPRVDPMLERLYSSKDSVMTIEEELALYPTFEEICEFTGEEYNSDEVSDLSSDGELTDSDDEYESEPPITTSKT
eukprot:6143-Heterococcus_DN1.PRE.1